jgi:hypothetical protein
MDILTLLIGLEVRLRLENATGYDQASIPNKLDDEIRTLIASFLSGTGLEHDLITSTFNENHSMTLLLFSELMASLAVRGHSEEILWACPHTPAPKDWTRDQD